MADVTVPDVVGMRLKDAVELGVEVAVVLVSAEPDGPSLRALTWTKPHIIQAQYPEAGAVVEKHSAVTVWFVPDGLEGSSVPAPIKPSPDRLEAKQALTPGEQD